MEAVPQRPIISHGQDERCPDVMNLWHGTAGLDAVWSRCFLFALCIYSPSKVIDHHERRTGEQMFCSWNSLQNLSYQPTNVAIGFYKINALCNINSPVIVVTGGSRQLPISPKGWTEQEERTWVISKVSVLPHSFSVMHYKTSFCLTSVPKRKKTPSVMLEYYCGIHWCWFNTYISTWREFV